MLTAYLAVTLLAVAANTFSGVAALTHFKPIIPGMAKAGVPESWLTLLGSDRHGKFSERDRYPPVDGLLDRQLVVPWSNVLDERVPGDQHPGTAGLFEAAHRSQPRLQPAEVALDPVVGALLGAVPRHRQQLLQHGRIHRRLIGDDLDGRDPGCADSPFEQPAGRGRVPPQGHQHLDDLSELVDGAVEVRPLASDFAYVSSTRQRSPTAWRHGRAASVSSGVNRCTHR